MYKGTMRPFCTYDKLETPINPDQVIFSAPIQTPDSIKKLYGIDKLDTSKNIDKFRPTIAIVDAYGNRTLKADLAYFSAQFNLPIPKFTQYYEEVNDVSNIGPAIFVEGDLPLGYPTDSGWSLESTLDVEWVHAIAPYADITMIIAQSSSWADMVSAVKFASNLPGVVAVNMSWGGGEDRSWLALEENFSNKRVVFLAASGDNGLGNNFPAVSPSVLAVGGTGVVTENSLIHEVACNFSGGGISDFFKMPKYQKKHNIIKKYSSKYRLTPDVAAFGAIAVAVYTSDPSIGAGWYGVYGTSVSVVIWSGIIGLFTQYRKKRFYRSHLQKLLYNILVSDEYHKYFNDITEGNNGANATEGYDLLTGIGTPKCDKLVHII